MVVPDFAQFCDGIKFFAIQAVGFVKNYNQALLVTPPGEDMPAERFPETRVSREVQFTGNNVMDFLDCGRGIFKKNGLLVFVAELTPQFPQ